MQLTCFLGSKPRVFFLQKKLQPTDEDNRASVVTSNWLPTGAQAAMSSTQASILEPNLGGMLLVAKMNLRSKPGDLYYPVIYFYI